MDRPRGHPITIAPNPKRVRVMFNGRVVADTSHALTLKEASLPPVQTSRARTRTCRCCSGLPTRRTAPTRATPRTTRSGWTGAQPRTPSGRTRTRIPKSPRSRVTSPSTRTASIGSRRFRRNPEGVSGKTVAEHAAGGAIGRKAASPEHRGSALLHRPRRSRPSHVGPHPSWIDGVHPRLRELAREQPRQRVQRGFARSVSTGWLLAEGEDVLEAQAWILQLAHQGLGLAGERAQPAGHHHNASALRQLSGERASEQQWPAHVHRPDLT